MNSEELQKHCMKVLSDVGASEDYTKFFVDVVQCESDIDANVHRMHQKLTPADKNEPADPNVLLANIQELTKSYHGWKGDIDHLSVRGRDLPPLKIDPNRLKSTQGLKALCSIQTKDLKLAAGDELKIIDTTQPNKLKVRTRGGEEGYIPALSCLLPSPDKNAISAPDRLKLHLLTSWRDSMNKSKGLLMACLVAASHQLSSDWKNKTTISSSGAKERVARRLRRLTETIDSQLPNWDLTKLHHALFSIEKELESWNIGNGAELEGIPPSDINDVMKHVAPVITIVASLDKAVLCYQMFRKQWYLYRKSLERCPRPMRIVDKVDQLRTVKSTRNFRYYEVKVTREEVETVEEIVEKKPPKSTVQAEQFTTQRAEERRRFVITAVVDPRSGELISFQDAINARIIDQSRGMYINPNTGGGMSIPEAMNNGSIKVEHSTAEVTKEETKAVGLITIKTRIEHQHFTIKQVTDAVSGRNMTLDEAKKDGIIDEAGTTYTFPGTGEKVSLEKAIEGGWVVGEKETDHGPPEFETKTYAVNSVVDQKQKKKIPFGEAVSLGLIDKDTGTYINNVTDERIHVAEAIKRGFLKAHEVKDTEGLNIDIENTVVVERMEKIRRNVLKSMGVIKAFKGKGKATKKPQTDNKPQTGADKPEQEAGKLQQEPEESQQQNGESQPVSEKSQAAKSEPEVVTSQQEAVKTQPMGDDSQPEAVNSQPVVVTSETEDVQSQPEDVQAQSEDVKSQPDDVKSQPQNGKPHTDPEATNLQQAAVKPQPEDVKSQPENVKSQPEDVKSQPKAVKSQPKAVKSPPKAAKPQPEAAKPQPEAAKPQKGAEKQPEAVKSEPEAAKSPKGMKSFFKSLKSKGSKSKSKGGKSKSKGGKSQPDK